MRALLAAAAIILGGCDGGATGGGAAPILVFGRTGVGPGEFNYPRAAVAAPGGRLYVVDKGGRIQCLTQTGESLLSWRMPEIGAGKPTGLGIAPDGRLFAADTHYNRVLIFDPSGEQVGEFGSPGDGPGQFRLPTDVAIDPAGFVYVAEYGGNDRVSKFSPDLEYLLSFGGREVGEGRLERPQSLVIASDNTIWIADACNHRVCRFDADGRFRSAFGRVGNAPGELRFPYNVDLLSDGTLVVCEYGNNRVQRFDAEGHSLGTWGLAGRRAGELAYPWARAVGRDDRVLIVDSGNNRVQVIDGRAARTWSRP